jgi:hypothetical protein
MTEVILDIVMQSRTDKSSKYVLAIGSNLVFENNFHLLEIVETEKFPFLNELVDIILVDSKWREPRKFSLLCFSDHFPNLFKQYL